jgi:ubiquinone/menaquinone biosynthesis C-methylase UbiE
VNHGDHVSLIRAGVEGAGPRWLELGAGEGAFTLALADVLGPGARILAVDRDRRALDQMRSRVAGRFPLAEVDAIVADFTRGLPDGPFDGVLAANSLHFVARPDDVLADIQAALTPNGRFVLVEYDADHGNPWVPHPISFDRWRREAPSHGFAEPRLIHRVPSRFLNAIYGSVSPNSRVVDSGPHDDDREQ